VLLLEHDRLCLVGALSAAASLTTSDVPLDTYGKRASKVTTECSIWVRNVVRITDPNKPFYSHRHTATSYLRNTRLLDGSPAVKEDIERYILGHAGRGAPSELPKVHIDETARCCAISWCGRISTSVWSSTSTAE